MVETLEQTVEKTYDCLPVVRLGGVLGSHDLPEEWMLDVLRRRYEQRLDTSKNYLAKMDSREALRATEEAQVLAGVIYDLWDFPMVAWTSIEDEDLEFHVGGQLTAFSMPPLIEEPFLRDRLYPVLEQQVSSFALDTGFDEELNQASIYPQTDSQERLLQAAVAVTTAIYLSTLTWPEAERGAEVIDHDELLDASASLVAAPIALDALLARAGYSSEDRQYCTEVLCSSGFAGFRQEDSPVSLSELSRFESHLVAWRKELYKEGRSPREFLYNAAGKTPSRIGAGHGVF